MNPEPSYREVGRPTFRTNADLCAWIAQQANVAPEEVEAAKRDAARARGQEWRGSDPVGHVRRRAFARLRSTTARKAAEHDRGADPVVAESRTAATSASARAARFTGRLGR
jgi:hypothetical protein